MPYQSRFSQVVTGAVGTLALCAAWSGTAAPLANDGATAKAPVSVKNKGALDAPPAANLAPPPAAAAAAETLQRNAAPSAVTTTAPGTDADSKEPSRRTKPKLAVRGRLDDGRYLGFHQSADDFRKNGDPVQAETDRLHRSRQVPPK